ncbi:MAG: hypothetical protein OEY26_10405 [Nitrospinota bacterium]|nr:hypothetical protein [Nitrospinota bacterium]
MSITLSRVAYTGLFFLFIFLSGIWLSHSGKPLNVIILTIHKSVGLAAGVFLVLTVYRIHQVAPLSPVEITAIVVTVLFFAGTVISGGLLSTDKPVPAAILRMHRITPVLTVLSTAVTLYLLLSRK